MPKDFNPKEWILIGDLHICPHSKEQIQVLQNLNQQIKGAIMCNETHHENSPPCHQIPSFPSLCNIETQLCYSGLRSDQSSLNEVQHDSDSKKSSS